MTPSRKSFRQPWCDFLTKARAALKVHSRAEKKRGGAKTEPERRQEEEMDLFSNYARRGDFVKIKLGDTRAH